MAAQYRTVVNRKSPEIETLRDRRALSSGRVRVGWPQPRGALARRVCGLALDRAARCFGENNTTVGRWRASREGTAATDGESERKFGWDSSNAAKGRWAQRCPKSQRCHKELDSEGFKMVADRLVEEAGITRCSTAS